MSRCRGSMSSRADATKGVSSSAARRSKGRRLGVLALVGGGHRLADQVRRPRDLHLGIDGRRVYRIQQRGGLGIVAACRRGVAAVPLDVGQQRELVGQLEDPVRVVRAGGEELTPQLDRSAIERQALGDPVQVHILLPQIPEDRHR